MAEIPDKSINEKDSEIRVALDFIQGIWGAPEPATGDTLGETKTPTVNSAIEAAPDQEGSFPQQIGRFQLKRLIGQGGFAKVFLAHDPTLNRKVALKVLNPTLFFSDDATSRFDREAQATAVLNHPNIVPVFETGMFESMRYIATAYVDGMTLETWFAKQKQQIDPREAAAVVVVLAEAVQHAHQRGVIHRDLKPANVLVELESTVDKGNGEASNKNALGFELRVTDFGLARYNDSLDQLNTTEGAIVGTPAFMSPEQAFGKSDVDSRTDIYSLGVILYELLTGRLPIQGKSHIDTLLAINKETPKPPSKVNRLVPRDLEAICLKCLNKDPGHRYESSHDLAVDLRRWLDGEPVSARHTSRLEKVGKWCRRNPVLTMAFLGLSAALGFAMIQWNSANEQWQNAQAENQRSQRAIALSQDTLNEMVGRVSQMQQLPPETRRDLTNRAVTLQNRLLEEDPSNESLKFNTAYSYLLHSRSLRDMREHDAALAVCDVALELMIDVNEPNSDELRERLLMSKVDNLRLQKRFDEALEIMEVDTSNTRATWQAADRLRDAGLIMLSDGDPASALIKLQQSCMIYETLDGNIYVAGNFASTLYFCGLAELQLDLLEESEKSLQRALQKQQFIISKSSFHEQMEEQLALIELKLGWVRKKTGNMESAKTLINNASLRFESLIQWNQKLVRYQESMLESQFGLLEMSVEEGSFDTSRKQIKSSNRFLVDLPTDSEYFNRFCVGQCDQIIALLQATDQENAAEQRERDMAIYEIGVQTVERLEANQGDPDEVLRIREALGNWHARNSDE